MIKKIKNPAIELHDVTVSYQGKPVLWDIDFQLPQGELIAIVGRNGAGKTTLLKYMMGLLPSQSGQVYFWGKSLDKVRKRVSYVPQRQSIDWQFPISVKDVVMMGRYPYMSFFKRAKKEDYVKVDEALEVVGMKYLANRQIGELSTGQQQRVFIARLLAQDADICLLDEPFAGVDNATTQLLLNILRELAQNGKTIVMVHHTLEAIQNYCTYALLLNTYVVAAGRVQEVMTPEYIHKAYQDRQSVLDSIRELLAKDELPIREEE